MDDHQIPVQEKKKVEKIKEQKRQQPEEKGLDFTQMKAEDYQNKDTRSNKEIESVIQETNTLLQEDDLQTDEKQRMDVHMRLQKEADLQAVKQQKAAKDKKWYRIFNSDSDDMTYFKNAVNYLNNQMDKEIPMMQIDDKTKMVDAQAAKDMLMPAYDTLAVACRRYLNSHEGRRHATGRRRRKNVKMVQDMIDTERERLKLALSNAQDMRLYDQDHAKTLRDLFPRVAVNEAEISRFMEEGNSSDVFRVRLKADNKYYYAKEDLRLLNENFTGYLDRRLEQLQNSKAKRAEQIKGLKSPQEYEAKCKEQDDMIKSIDRLVLKIGAKANPSERLAPEDAAELAQLCEQLKAHNLMTKERADELIEKEELSDVEADKLVYSIRKDQEELRLRGQIDDDDYQAGQDFLGTMKNRIESQKDEHEQDELKKRYLKFLGHDFDRLFYKLQCYNLKILEAKGNKEELQVIINVMKKDDSSNPALAMLEASLKNAEELKAKTPYEYICDLVKEGKMGLDAEKDQDVLDILKNLQQKGGERVQRLFTRTLGKEAELYGQQCERSGIDDSSILASNNTATSRLAKIFGFDDVVTTSYKCMMKNRGDKNFKSYTLSEEAEGEEMLTLVTQAKDAGVKLQYSSNAVRQLTRLQLFDTLCLQTDRHWRNFKCKVTKKKDQWIIESLRSYDHDQSFGARSLADYFKEQMASKGKDGQMGFLNPYVMEISKDDVRYDYLRKKLIGTSDDKILQSIKMPLGKDFKFKPRGKATSRIKLDKEGKTTPCEAVPLVARTYFNTLPYVTINMEWDWLKELNKGKETVVDEFRKEFDFLRDLLPKIADLKNDKIKARKDEKEKGYSLTGVLRQLRKVKMLYDQLNMKDMEKLAREKGRTLETPQFYTQSFSDPSLDLSRRDGFFDYMVQGMMYLTITRCGMDQSVLDQLAEEDKEDYVNAHKEDFQRNPGAPDVSAEEKALERQRMCGIGTSTLRIPTMLHMDKDAFDKIKSIANDKAEFVDCLMRELGWDANKRAALITRARELVAQIEEAAEIADAWYENWNTSLQNPDPNDKTWEREKDPRYIPKTDIRRKFFLEYKEEKVEENGVEKTNVVQDDYKLIKNLTDVATDPSMTYFSIEDPNFLAGEKDYAENMQQSDRNHVVKTSNECRKHRRQHGLKQMESFREYSQLVGNQIA